jgi:glycosyltransferase involved in cell wall biosynthesis
MNPAVSVLMPVYNARRYLAEAVESVLAQSFGDFELIALDDGSTDRSASVLHQYAARDPRVRVVSRENRGLVATLNEMIAMARGDLLARLDADDVAMPERFAVQVAYLRDHPDIICIGTRVRFIDEAGRFLHEGHPAMDHDQIQELALKGQCPLAHTSVMMRRDPVAAVGGYRDEMEHAEDTDLWLRLGEVGRIVNLPDALVKYRLHDRSKCEVFMADQARFMKLASDQACDRRGIAHRYIPPPAWRPTDRRSRFDFTVHYGWQGFLRGDRRVALAYGMKAIRVMPWRAHGWRLLACAAIKPMGKPS